MLTPRIARRRGFTLVQMISTMVVFGLVAGTTVRIIVRQQRFYIGSAQMISVRTNLRDAAGVLSTDIRGISSVGSDIYAMSDSAIDFRLPSGLATICSIGVGRTTVVIPPVTLTSRSAVTSWTTAPVNGDTAFVYSEGAGPTTADDSWQLVALSAAPIAGVCPTTSGFTSTAGEVAASLTLTVTPALAAGVAQGSVIRFYRRAKYKLYQPTTNGAWYVGYLDCPGGTCGTLQAVAGPYLPYSATASATGLRFVYRDSTGAVTATRANVARIDITARTQTLDAVRMPGRAVDYYRDSVVVSVALRNRS